MLFDAISMAFVVVTGLTLVLLAGSGALVALWLIRNRDTEPDDPYAVALPQFPMRIEHLRKGGQQVSGPWIGEAPPAEAAYVQEELPF